MLAKLSLLVASILLTLGAFEVAIRVGAIQPTSFVVSDAWWKENWLRRKRGGNPREFINLDRDLGWIPAANLDGIEYEGVRIHTNASHMRGAREIPLERTGATRIVTVGDSYTFGQCAEEDETFPAVIEQELPDTEVLNLGVMGYGQDQALIRLRRDGFPYRPDVVVFGFHGSDMRRNMLSFRDYGKPRFRLTEDGGLELQNTPIPEPDAYEGIWPPRLLNYLQMYRDGKRYETQEFRRSLYTMAQAIVHQMAEDTHEAGARLVVTHLPRPGNLKHEDVPFGWAWFEQLCEGDAPAPFLCVDPVPRFRRLLPTPEAVREAFDCHYSPELYRAVGEATADAILRSYPDLFPSAREEKAAGTGAAGATAAGG